MSGAPPDPEDCHTTASSPLAKVIFVAARHCPSLVVAAKAVSGYPLIRIGVMLPQTTVEPEVVAHCAVKECIIVIKD